MIKKVSLLLSDLESNIPFFEHQRPEISSSSIGWHIEHSLLTLDRIIDRLSQTDSRDYKWKMSFPRLYVFATNTIPRGRGKSPQSVKPDAEIDHQMLTQHIKLTKEKITILTTMGKGQFFEHPYFGHLKLKQTVKFLEIHTKHHLKIIEDIRS